MEYPSEYPSEYRCEQRCRIRGWDRIGIAALACLSLPALGNGSTGDLRPESQAHSRSIFRCEIAGVRTFSDRPCGSAVRSPTAEPDTVELGTLNILESRAVATASPAAKSGKPSAPRASAAARRSAAAAQVPKADACGRIQQSLRKITSKMRTGYTAKEGERLRERRKDLEEKRRAQRC